MRLAHLVSLLSLLAQPAFAQDEEAVNAPAEPQVAEVGTPIPPGGLGAALALLPEDPIFRSAAVSVEVVDVADGHRVWNWGDDRALRPASTMKLVTAATALRTLGPAYRFPTWIMADGPVEGDGVLKGNLYVKGQGDPTMVTERMWRMLIDLKMRGVKKVEGDLIFDDSYYADTAEIPGWDNDEDRQEGPTYAAPLGALSVNYNVLALTVHSGANAGDPVVVETDTPSAAVVIDNRMITGNSKSRTTVHMERSLDPTGKIATFRLTGTWNIDREPEVWRKSIADPLTHYMGTFKSIAKQVGLEVKGSYRAGVTPKDAKLVYRFDSEPLSKILADMNKLSQNFFAETVLRAVGAETRGLPGTTAKGIASVTNYLDSLGVPAGGYQLVNGSGLSRGVLLKPSTLNRVLVDMWNSPEVGAEFQYSLSVGGRDGTLRSRFKDAGMEGRVRGKTGTLSGVTCLAGYVQASDGKTYAFSFFVNDVNGALSRAKRAHDRLVRTLVGTSGTLVDTAEGEELTP